MTRLGYSGRVKVFTLLLFFVLGSFSSEAASNTKAATKSTAKNTTTKSSPAKATPKSPSRKATGKSSKKTVAARPPRPVTPQQPTSDRYREIQQALIDKGFLEGTPSGQWDTQSVAAFKKFEQSQNLREDGKIDSMALIALGLGPGRTQTASVTQ